MAGDGDQGRGRGRYLAISRKGLLRQIFGANRETADALFCAGVDCIAQRGGNDRQARFADARGFFLAHDHVDFGFWSLAHARHLVIVEIGLFDAATHDGDGVMQGCR